MPDINSIPEVLYQPNQPYHYHYDNLPLRNILTRIGLVNIQVDTNTDLIRGAAGTAGSIDARLNVALDDAGNLNASAIDAASHNIGYHADGIGADLVEYVRMTLEERDKLSLIESEANKIFIEVEDSYPTIGITTTLDTGTVKFEGSSTILLDFVAPNIIKFYSALPPDVSHRHYYGVTPANQNVMTPDYTNFITTSINTPYQEDTLRVYINGVRIYANAVPVPNTDATSFLATYVASEDYTTGDFALNRALTINDIVRIDFDELFF